MIEIIVDCNNDSITFTNGHTTFQYSGLKQPNMVCDIVKSLFDMIEENKKLIHSPKYTRLSKIDEDTQTTIDEW